MTESSEKKVKIKNKLSEWILDYDKNAYCDSKIDDETREILIDSFNECSDLRKSFHDSLNNFFNNLGFSSSMKIFINLIIHSVHQIFLFKKNVKHSAI